MEAMDNVGKSKEDVTLPKATMFKIIKEMLPRDVRVARDAHDLLVECCVEFINLVSSNPTRCAIKKRKEQLHSEPHSGRTWFSPEVLNQSGTTRDPFTSTRIRPKSEPHHLGFLPQIKSIVG